MHDFKGSFRKNHVQSSITLPECMTLTENLPTTIFSVKLMHPCILGSALNWPFYFPEINNQNIVVEIKS